MGVTELKTTLGNTIKIYNLERTICDILRSRNSLPETYLPPRGYCLLMTSLLSPQGMWNP